jgi:hypothetical protein
MPAKQYRQWHDAQVWTHLFFAPGLVCSFFTLPELCLILSVVFVLSIANHVNYERDGLLSMVEGVAAKSLYVYGVAQLCYGPYQLVFMIEFMCFVCTTATFLTTLTLDLYKTSRAQWNFYHPLGMHVIPAVWVLMTAMSHTPLLTGIHARTNFATP